MRPRLEGQIGKVYCTISTIAGKRPEILTRSASSLVLNLQNHHQSGGLGVTRDPAMVEIVQYTTHVTNATKSDIRLVAACGQQFEVWSL